MENQLIVSLPSKEMRSIARSALKGFWKIAILTTIVYYLAISIPSSIIGTVFTGNLSRATSGIYSLLVTGAFTYGYYLFLLSIFRKKEHGISQVFAGFEYFGKTFLILLIICVKTILWAMLFVVPGIIAAIRYSQCFLIMIDHPEYSANQCVEASKKMMQGNKEKYFCLCLSYFGWAFLASIPTAIVLNLGMQGIIPMTSLAFALLSVLAELAMVVILPYIEMGNIVMYEIMAGYLRPVTNYNENDYTGFMANEVKNEVKNDVTNDVTNEVKNDDNNNINDINNEENKDDGNF